MTSRLKMLFNSTVLNFLAIIFWVTLLAVGIKFDLPMLLGIVSAAAAVTFIGFALNASYSSLADVQEVEVQKIYLTDDKQTSHIK